MSLANAGFSVFDDYYSNTRPSLVELLPAAPKAVLDVGCGRGAYLRICADRGATALYGVELRADVADALMRENWVNTVLVGSVETVDLAPLKGQFDLIIASFVLEHVADPWAVLQRLRSCLRPGGRIVGSLPNVRFLPVSTRLLALGRWQYESEGVMDWTHLRFFTRSTIEELFADCDFAFERMTPEFGRRAKLVNGATLGLLKDFFAYGYNFSVSMLPTRGNGEAAGPRRLLPGGAHLG